MISISWWCRKTVPAAATALPNVGEGSLVLSHFRNWRNLTFFAGNPNWNNFAAAIYAPAPKALAGCSTVADYLEISLKKTLKNRAAIQSRSKMVSWKPAEAFSQWKYSLKYSFYLSHRADILLERVIRCTWNMSVGFLRFLSQGCDATLNDPSVWACGVCFRWWTTDLSRVSSCLTCSDLRLQHCREIDGRIDGWNQQLGFIGILNWS